MGVTLLELIVVIAVLSVMLSLAAWRLPRQDARAYSNDVRAILVQGRYEAIKRNALVAVVWDEAAREFFSVANNIAESQPCSSGGPVLLRASVTDYARTAVDVRVFDSDGNVVTGAVAGVVWFPNGQARSCSKGLLSRTIATISDRSGSYDVTVSVAGKVEVQ